MTLAICLLVLAAFLAGATAGVIAVVIAGIRTEDRNKTLKGNPRTYAEAGTRRVAGVGTRNNNNEDGS